MLSKRGTNLAENPLDRNIAVLYSGGIALVEGMPRWRSEFARLFQGVKDVITTKQVTK